MRERTCALVVVGNEVLSGKTQDSNAYFDARQLRAVGVALQRITVIPDEVPLIAEEVSYCTHRFDIVLTSGGVGPTHDDVTMDGVATAFGRKLVTHPELERLLRTHFADRLTAAALKMAAVPEGAVLNSATVMHAQTEGLWEGYDGEWAHVSSQLISLAVAIPADR